MSEPTPLSVHKPQGPPKGGIIVCQEAAGVTDHLEDVCRRLAAEGWLAVAPHLYHRSGDPKLAYPSRANDYDVSEIVAQSATVTAVGVLEDVDAALDHLAGAGISAAMTGVVGFCMGGTVAVITCAERDVGAGVTFYGTRVSEPRFGFPPVLEEAKHLRAPWLGLFGDLDHGNPIADIEALRTAAAVSGQITEIVRYPEAGHSFHCDVQENYHAPSAQDAWRRTLAWFDEHLTA